MRVLLAHDGSASAEQAANLTAAIDWPASSILEVVSAIEPMPILLPTPWSGGAPATTPELQDQVAAYFEEEAAAVATRLAPHFASVEGVAIGGRPASVILDEARAFAADVVIMGSRGRGPIAELVLGSVSAEVVDQASFPVLVARRSGVSRILLAADGSRAALAAEDVLARWPVFAALPIRALSVAEVVQPWHTGIAPTLYRQVVEAYAEDLTEARSAHTRLADDAAARLRESGRHAESSIRTGDAALEIIADANEVGADLIVVGSRGRTGLTRIVLGSVARNVLHGSAASVLVVHGDVDADGANTPGVAE